jgi:hypothetical protein
VIAAFRSQLDFQIFGDLPPVEAAIFDKNLIRA